MPNTKVDSPVQPCGNKPVPPIPKKPDEKHFVEFKVVDEKGKPVEDVVLLIKLPDGSKEEHTTNKDGVVKIENIKPGSCHIISNWHKLKVEDTVLLQ
ncbi:MAG: hypothetical protein ABJB86_07730 [Bacteroidota bacterium]